MFFRYGYIQNQPQNEYYFSQPHMMHRFSMRDLPKESSGYREKATDIEIQQSHSFEIKEENYSGYQPSASGQQYQHEQVYEDPVPVIVLRIPGPQKYAVHLQALLQQYLEIRAAQYITALEHQERHGHLMHPQHYVAQEQHQMQYIPMVAIPPLYQQQQYYQQQQQQQHARLQHELQQHGHHGYRHGYQVQNENTYQVPTGDQSYYHQPQVHQQVEEEYHESSHAPKQHHTHEFATSYINFVTPAYEQGEVHQPQIHHHNHHDDEPLETSENYPSDKHTQVIFKKKKNRAHRPTASYHKSLPIVVPDTSAPELLQEEVYPQHQQEPIHYSHHQPEHDSHSYANNHNEYRAGSDVVAVTQRSSGPINYHVMQSTLAPTPDELNDRHHPKRMAPFTKEQFEKARRMMMPKSKRNRGSQRQEKVLEKPMKLSSN